MKNSPKIDAYIGIDTGTNTGVAVWVKDLKRFSTISTMMIHEAMEWVINVNASYEGKVLVRVEDARLATFGRQNDISKAQGAGSVKRDCSIWQDFLTDKKIPFELVRPNKKLSKLPDLLFRNMTGWKERTSQHARDSAMLVYGY